MSREYADTLQDMLEAGDEWPLKHEQPVIARVAEWAAFSESDSHVLQAVIGWQDGRHQHLPYVVDPLPERIKDAFADLIFGAETDFEAPEGDGQQGDQELLDDVVEENDLPGELQAAAGRCVAEGEVWWRIYVDRDAYEHPVVEWHSRANVVPLYRGKKLLAAAFIYDLDDLTPDAPVVRVGDDADPPGTRMWRVGRGVTDGDDTRWRYVEIQTGGMTRNLLYKGERAKLGEREPLTAHEATADLPDEWQHGLEVRTRSGRAVPLMLAGRVANGRAGRLGRSQYAGVRDLLYELNKVASIGGRNVELTMQKRAVIAADVVSAMASPQREGESDLDYQRRRRMSLPDAFMAPATTAAGADDMGDSKPMGVLEFSDTWADAMLAWDGGLTDKILTRCRVAPQLVGRHTEDAATGPALRARLMDSVLAADGKARAWDDALPKILRAVQLVDALAEESGGCGHDWKRPEEPPVVIRTSILPEDEGEEATRHAQLVGARLEARRTAVERLNVEWDEDRVEEEMRLIDEDGEGRVSPPPDRNGRAPMFGANAQGGTAAAP
ncbi:MAG TPA: hypothetical protein VN213_13570 [Solirubrobacteraceae bacterium]|nr:hypothetical protein [Solirubrobacteraceae bacterium]